MNITFLIGNGFDIGMGLSTRFSDYFPIYQAESLDKEKAIKEFSENIVANEEEWSCFEYQIGQYTARFDPMTKQKLIDQLTDFTNGFMNYLKRQEEKLSFDEVDAIAEKMKKGLLEYYTTDNLQVGSSAAVSNAYSANSAEEHRYNFITFNYTSILEKCLESLEGGIVGERKLFTGGKKIDKVGKVIHVHGERENYPITGVNDASQVAQPELAADESFLRYIVKSSINESLRMNYDKNATALIEKSAIICVYGMSLGETDRKWWDMILNWLSNNPNRQLVLFVRDGKFVLSNPYMRLEKEDEILDRLTAFSLNSVNAETLRSQIHIAVNRDIFAMDLAKRHNEMMELALAKLVNV